MQNVILWTFIYKACDRSSLLICLIVNRVWKQEKFWKNHSLFHLILDFYTKIASFTFQKSSTLKTLWKKSQISPIFNKFYRDISANIFLNSIFKIFNTFHLTYTLSLHISYSIDNINLFLQFYSFRGKRSVKWTRVNIFESFNIIKRYRDNVHLNFQLRIYNDEIKWANRIASRTGNYPRDRQIFLDGKKQVEGRIGR